MLKVSQVPEEHAGKKIIAWWEGEGAAPVLAHDGEASLMQRAHSSTSLTQMVNCGRAE